VLLLLVHGFNVVRFVISRPFQVAFK